ncbi:MAG TPA: hypothetical protein VII78_14000, partial [Myxococcota bacterium]
MADDSGAARAQSARNALAICGVALLLLAAYWPSLGGGFIWDDDAHVVDNVQLRDLAGLFRIWIPGHTPQFYPVTFSVFWLEYQLFGPHALGYDLVNLALHALNALLVWRLLRELNVRAAGAIAAVFALHPLHVESVAWVMELKNTLSGALYLGAALCYSRFDRAREAAPAASAASARAWRDYALALGLFALALLSKSVTSTLPAALVLLLALRGGALSPRRLAPLAPLFALGVALALHTAWLERELVGARGAEFDFTLAERALIASKALLFYAQKLLVPVRLLFCYPRWAIQGAALSMYWPVAVVAALSAALLVAYRRGWRSGPLALAFYAGSLFPALGFIDFYPMIYSFVADHFAYLPSLGVIAFAVGGAASSLGSARARRAAAVAVALGLAALTRQQSAHFRDAQTLYRHSIAHSPSGYLCVALTGTELIREAQAELDAGRVATAKALFREGKGFSERALALKEDQQATHFDLAVAQFALGEAEAGLAHATRSAELAPNQVDAQLLAAGALEAVGRRSEAAARLERVLALAPERADVALRLAGLLRPERPAEAARHLRAALAHAADDDETRREASLQLSWLLATSRLEALRAPREALELARGVRPRGPRVLRAEAAALAALGRFA